MFKTTSQRRFYLVWFLVILLLFALISYPLSHYYQTKYHPRGLLTEDIFQADSQLEILEDERDNVLGQIRNKLDILNRNVRNIRSLKTLQDFYFKFTDSRHANQLLNVIEAKQTVRYGPSPSKNHHPKVVVLIMSAVENTQRRFLIRKTWASIKELSFQDGMKIKLLWKMYFVVGSRLSDLLPQNAQQPEGKKTIDYVLHEINLSRDMIVANILDVPNFQKEKLYLALHWLNNKLTFEYILVVQDTMFVNIPRLYEFVHSSHKPSHGLYAGNIEFTKIDKSKNFHPNLTVYKSRYAKGKTFLMSNDVSRKIVKNYVAQQLVDFNSFFGDIVLRSGVDVWEERGFLLDNCIYDANNIVTDIPEDFTSSCFSYLFNMTTTQSKNMKRKT